MERKILIMRHRSSFLGLYSPLVAYFLGVFVFPIVGSSFGVGVKVALLSVGPFFLLFFVALERIFMNDALNTSGVLNSYLREIKSMEFGGVEGE